MKNIITNLEVNNFKSIKDIKIDCKRINVFIGEPNVGKSNILEALSLFCAPLSEDGNKFLKEYIRFEKHRNLFYDNDRKNNIKVKTNIGEVYIREQANGNDIFEMYIGEDDFMKYVYNNLGKSAYLLNQDLPKTMKEENNLFAIKSFIHSFGDNYVQTLPISYNIPFKRYIFRNDKATNTHPFQGHLTQPFGDNLYRVLENNPKLFEEVSHFFIHFGLDLLIDTEYNKLEIQKKIGTRVYKIPYSLAADTLRRIIFYLAAIETNDDAILLLEEPEAHSFPPYVSMLAEKIIESKNNQFFVATHSPYMLTEFIEKGGRDEVSIFICNYENYETNVRALSEAEIENIMETGIDLFFNIPAFKK